MIKNCPVVFDICMKCFVNVNWPSFKPTILKILTIVFIAQAVQSTTVRSIYFWWRLSSNLATCIPFLFLPSPHDLRPFRSIRVLDFPHLFTLLLAQTCRLHHACFSGFQSLFSLINYSSSGSALYFFHSVHYYKAISKSRTLHFWSYSNTNFRCLTEKFHFMCIKQQAQLLNHDLKINTIPT